MASSVAMKTSIILLLTLFFSMKTQARDSQFFNKVSSTTTNVVPTQEQPSTTNVVPNKEQPLNNNQQREPDFLPENENGYGLYGHESSQLPPSASTATEPTTTTTAEPTTASTTAVAKEPLHKYLPKNYNPVAYVTEPENIDDNNSFAEDTYSNNLNNKNNYYNDAQNYHNNQAQREYQTGEPEYRSYTTDAATANNRYSNYNYNGGSSFNSGPQGLSDTGFMGGVTQNRRENSFYNGDEESSFQPQGISDTRSMENGKYFYHLNNEEFSETHPYEGVKGVRAKNEYNDRNFYGNSYQNQYEFPNEQNLP